MKCAVLLSIVFALVISLAAPTGAAFASEEIDEAVVNSPVIGVQESDSSKVDAGTETDLLPSSEELTPPPFHDEVEAAQEFEASLVPDPVVPSPVLVTPPDAPSMAEPVTTPPLIITTFDVSFGLEFVELYNQSDAPIGVDQVRLQASAENDVCLTSIADNGFIMPGEFFYVQSPTYQGVGVSDRVFSSDCLVGSVITRVELFVAGNRVQLIDGVMLGANQWGAHSGAWKKEAGKDVHKDFTSIKQSGAFKDHYILIAANPSSLFTSNTYVPPDSSFGLKIVELLPNSRSCAPDDEGYDCNDYIKVWNDSEQSVNLALFRLRTGSRSANATMTTSFNWHEPTLHPARDELELPAGQYFVLALRNDLAPLALSNGESNVWLEDYYGTKVYQSVSYQGMDLAAARGKSWAYDSQRDLWRFGIPSPHGVNVPYEAEEEPGRGSVPPRELVPCRDDQYRSEETNRCRNLTTANTLTPCREGQYRSEETSRCRSIATAAAAVLKPCADDQFRNPETNRCKKIASSDDIALADCGEGRERNPETNRCRNVLGVSALAETVPFPVESVEQVQKRFTGWLTIGVVVLLGAGYGAWEWREELRQAGRRVGRFVGRSK